MRPPTAIFCALLLLAAGPTAQAQWQIQHSGTSASLRGITTAGEGVAWASGTEGTVLHTTDGGAHWTPCPTPPGAEHLDFRGIQAFDAQTAIVMSSGKGDLSRLYKTTDACHTWRLVFTNPDKDGFWDALQFDFRQSDLRPRLPTSPTRIALRHGVIVGDPVNRKAAIFETYDSGQTWWPWPNSKGSKAAKTKPLESLFAASNTSLIVPGLNGEFAFVTGGADGSRLIVAEHHDILDNGGWTSFTSLDLPFPRSESAGAFSAAARYNPDYFGADIIVVGGDYKNADASRATAFFVHATGLSLFRHAIATNTPPHGYRSSVAYDPTHKTWITVGPNGTDISTDDGRNWRPLKPDSAAGDPEDADRNWNALSLPFVVGPHGRIGKLRPTALTPAPKP